MLTKIQKGIKNKSEASIDAFCSRKKEFNLIKINSVFKEPMLILQMREVTCRNTLEYHTIQLLLIIQAGDRMIWIRVVKMEVVRSGYPLDIFRR